MNNKLLAFAVGLLLPVATVLAQQSISGATIRDGTTPLTKLAPESANTIVGNCTGSSAVPTACSAAAAKSSLAVSCADLTNAAASCATDATNADNSSSGTLPAGRLPALTGDVTTTAGSAATTIAPSAVTSAKIADGAIVNADVNSSAAIALSKLATQAARTVNGNGTSATAGPTALTDPNVSGIFTAQGQFSSCLDLATGNTAAANTTALSGCGFATSGLLAPSGTFSLNTSFTNLNGKWISFWGGQPKTTDGTGMIRAPMVMHMLNPPSSGWDGVGGGFKMFGTDAGVPYDHSHQLFTVEHYVADASSSVHTIGQPTTGYARCFECMGFLVATTNKSGWADKVGSNTSALNDGRTGNSFFYVRGSQGSGGQGDFTAYEFSQTVSSLRESQSDGLPAVHFLVSPTVGGYGGDAIATVNYAYLQPIGDLNCQTTSNAFDVACIGQTFNLRRTNAQGAKAGTWMGVNVQSTDGERFSDAAYRATNLYAEGLNLDGLTAPPSVPLAYSVAAVGAGYAIGNILTIPGGTADGTTVTRTASTLSAQASDNSINDSANLFVTNGFKVGRVVNVSGFTGASINNNTTGRVITAVTAGKLTFGGTDGDDLVDDAAGESVTLLQTTNGQVTKFRVQTVDGGGGVTSIATERRGMYSTAPTGSPFSPTCKTRRLGEGGVTDANVSNEGSLPDCSGSGATINVTYGPAGAILYSANRRIYGNSSNSGSQVWGTAFPATDTQGLAFYDYSSTKTAWEFNSGTSTPIALVDGTDSTKALKIDVSTVPTATTVTAKSPAADSTLIGILASTAYASLPAASAANKGLMAFVSNLADQVFVSNGTKWVPLNGTVNIFKKSGSLASPLATISGATSGTFSITGGNPTIPAGLLAQFSRMTIRALVRKNGANSTANFNERLGTAQTTADSIIQARTITNADNEQVNHFNDIYFSSTSAYTTNDKLGIQTQSTATLADRTSNVNTASAMFVTVDISSGNASDSYDLIWLSVDAAP